MMRSLFLRIFLSFWAAMLLVLSATAAAVTTSAIAQPNITWRPRSEAKGNAVCS